MINNIKRRKKKRSDYETSQIIKSMHIPGAHREPGPAADAMYVGPLGGWSVYTTTPISLISPCILARDPNAGITRSLWLFFFFFFFFF